jgi:hypothetical protein
VDWSYGLVLWTGPLFWSFGLIQWTCEIGHAGCFFGLACGLILLAGLSDLFCELDLRTGPAWGRSCRLIMWTSPVDNVSFLYILSNPEFDL